MTDDELREAAWRIHAASGHIAPEACPDCLHLARAALAAAPRPDTCRVDGHSWVWTCAECGASESAAPRPEGLDVVQLEGAVFAAAFSAQDDVTEEWISYNEVVERIAAEYQRLSEPV